jgi:peptide/nickel transport system permease protein
LLSNPKTATGLAILTPIVVISIFAPYITPFDPLETHLLNRFAGPGGKYLLGTDQMGRDLLSRVIVGGQTTLFLGVAASALSLSLGVPIGIVAGYKRERIDELLMRAMDVIMSIPTLLLGILILTVLPPNIWNVIFAVGIVYAPRVARVVRSATLSEVNNDYVNLARVRGESDVYIMFREILPNVMTPILVEGSMRVGYAILVGSSLSFLGLGTQPPAADWGYMVASARSYMFQTPWFLLWPSVALILTIFGINLLGDGLRDVLDVKNQEAG